MKENLINITEDKPKDINVRVAKLNINTIIQLINIMDLTTIQFFLKIYIFSKTLKLYKVKWNFVIKNVKYIF